MNITSKRDFTEGTIIIKAILLAGGLRIRGKALYRSLNKVWSTKSFGYPAARLRRFRLVERGSLKGTVFSLPYETGLGVSPCKSVGYMGLNAPVVKR